MVKVWRTKTVLNKEQGIKQKMVTNMVDINPTILRITKKINSPNALIKKVIDRMDPNKRPIYVIQKKCTLKAYKD